MEAQVNMPVYTIKPKEIHHRSKIYAHIQGKTEGRGKSLLSPNTGTQQRVTHLKESEHLTFTVTDGTIQYSYARWLIFLAPEAFWLAVVFSNF